jgi:hypothetical protein
MGSACGPGASPTYTQQECAHIKSQGGGGGGYPKLSPSPCGLCLKSPSEPEHEVWVVKAVEVAEVRWSVLPRPHLVFLALGLEGALGSQGRRFYRVRERPWPGAPLVPGAASEAITSLAAARGVCRRRAPPPLFSFCARRESLPHLLTASAEGTHTKQCGSGFTAPGKACVGFAARQPSTDVPRADHIRPWVLLGRLNSFNSPEAAGLARQACDPPRLDLRSPSSKHAARCALD